MPSALYESNQPSAGDTVVLDNGGGGVRDDELEHWIRSCDEVVITQNQRGTLGLTLQVRRGNRKKRPTFANRNRLSCRVAPSTASLSFSDRCKIPTCAASSALQARAISFSKCKARRLVTLRFEGDGRFYFAISSRLPGIRKRTWRNGFGIARNRRPFT